MSEVSVTVFLPCEKNATGFFKPDMFLLIFHIVYIVVRLFRHLYIASSMVSDMAHPLKPLCRYLVAMWVQLSCINMGPFRLQRNTVAVYPSRREDASRTYSTQRRRSSTQAAASTDVSVLDGPHRTLEGLSPRP